MPLYKTIHISPAVRLHIWKITENEEYLSEGVVLNESNNIRVNGMKSELHRRGFLSIRHLMRLEGYEDKDLYYDGAGKPHLKDGNHISITHSFEFTGIIVSSKEKVGIDIEKQREKIIKIAHKFTTLKTDLPERNQNELIRKLTILWGAKESLYKICEIPDLSFRQHIFIEPEFMRKDWFYGEVYVDALHSSYSISCVEFEGFTCVYALIK